MGLMTAIRKLRYPVSTDQFNPPLDFQRLAEDVDKNLFPSQPNVSALPGTDNWTGRLFYVEDVQALYRWATAGGWKLIAATPIDSDPATIALGPKMGLQVAGSNLRRIGTTAHLTISFNVNSPGAAINDVLGTLPAEFRPVNNKYLMITITSGVGRGTGFIELNSAGVMSILSMTATGGTLVRIVATYQTDL